MRNEVDIFDFNLFNDGKEREKLPHSYTDYLFRVGSFLYGLFVLNSTFLYVNTKDMAIFDYWVVVIMGGVSSMLFSIYLPVSYYINHNFYNRLIVSLLPNTNNQLSITLYNKKNVKITNYEIIYDWVPYASTFFLFFHKVDSYKTSRIFENENAFYYTIKDLDADILYLFCVNKEQYLDALQKQKLQELRENE